MVPTDQLHRQVFYFCGRVGGGGGGVEDWRLKQSSAKVEVEVEAELGNFQPISTFPKCIFLYSIFI